MKIKGEIKVPGDKSITHRALILNAISNGEAKIFNYLTSEDIFTTINVLQALGVYISFDNDYITIKGNGLQD